MLHISIAKHARYLQPSSKLIATSYDEAIKRALSLIPYPLSLIPYPLSPIPYPLFLTPSHCTVILFPVYYRKNISLI